MLHNSVVMVRNTDVDVVANHLLQALMPLVFNVCDRGGRVRDNFARAPSITTNRQGGFERWLGERCARYVDGEVGTSLPSLPRRRHPGEESCQAWASQRLDLACGRKVPWSAPSQLSMRGWLRGQWKYSHRRWQPQHRLPPWDQNPHVGALCTRRKHQGCPPKHPRAQPDSEPACGQFSESAHPASV